MPLSFNQLMRALLAGNSVPSPITALITTNRVSASNTGVAPFAVHFDATGTTATGVSNPFRDLYHSWDFGDNTTDTWAYGTQPGVAKKNLASGGVAAHVYETPGTYTVNYICINPMTGDSTSASITITVLDPDVVFAANTVYVSTGTLVAGSGGVPSGANIQSSVTSWAAVLALAPTYMRILLKRGDVWSIGASVGFSVAGPGIIGAFGTGANPKLQSTATGVVLINSGNGTCQDWRFVDLESTTSGLAEGAARNGNAFFLSWAAASTSGQYNLFLRINHHDAGLGIGAGSDTVIADSNIDNISGGGGNVGIWCIQRERVAVIGTSVNDVSKAEMNIRLQGVRRAVISNCLIKYPIAGGSKNAIAMRGWEDGTGAHAWLGIYSEYNLVSDNEIVGTSQSGLVQFGSQSQANYDERHRYFVVERNRIVNQTNYGACVLTTGSTDFSIRSNLFVGSGGTEYAVVMANGASTTANSFAVLPPTNVQLYNNSYYSADVVTHAVEFVWVNSAAATGVDVKNNVMYMPACTGPCLILKAAVGAVCTASYNTVDGNITTTSPNFTATPPVTIADWTPTSGYAVNGGVQVPVYDDVLGVVRTGTFDMGALQP